MPIGWKIGDNLIRWLLSHDKQLDASLVVDGVVVDMSVRSYLFHCFYLSYLFQTYRQKLSVLDAATLWNLTEDCFGFDMVMFTYHAKSDANVALC